MRLKQIFIFGILFYAGFLKAQLTTNNTRSADDLVRNVLAAGGVTISNVTYSGSSIAIGEFFGANSNIGLNHGIILSTGTVLDGVDALDRKNGPMGPNNNPGASTSHNLSGDPDVLSLTSGTASHDAAIIEFDFIPEGDTVRFRYVFASEEYPKYVGTINNDAFGFFISGPGFSGKKNIALIPGTSTPVSINNVNSGLNSTYYVNNGEGLSGTSQFTNSAVVNFNGFTRVLEAVTRVTPCQTYHLKIAISDISDGVIDSGVFLEASSLYSLPTFELNQEVNYAPTSSNTVLYEGCSHGELVVTRSEKLGTVLNIPFKVYGSATSGADYLPFPNSVTFAPGETSKTISIQSIRDADVESDEIIILRFRNPSACKSDSVDITYSIKDLPAINTTTRTYNPTCSGDEVELDASATGGVPTFSYVWYVGGTGASKTVNPSSTTVYHYEVTDGCGQTKRDSALVQVPVYPALQIIALRDTIVRCRGAEVTYQASVSGGAGGYTFVWSSGESSSSAIVPVLQSQTITVNVNDLCGENTSASADINLNYPAFTANSTTNTAICYGDSLLISGSATGGIPPYTYYWNGLQQTDYWAKGIATQSYLFEAFDSCGIVPAISTTLVSVQKPQADFEINAPVPEPGEKISFLNKSVGAVRYYWDFGNSLFSSQINPNTSYDEPTNYVITLYAYDDLSCADTIVLDLQLQHPLYYFVPTAFTPNDDGRNDVFIGKHRGVTNFELYIYNRWGNLIFQTTNPEEGWDGNFSNGQPAPEDVYVVKYKAKSVYREDKEYNRTISLTLVR